MKYFLNSKCLAVVSLLNFLQVISECFVINNRFSIVNIENTSESEALILTSYIENSQLAEARLASEVTNLPKIGHPFTSYSGYFTVNAIYNSNMFFWIFPPLNGDPNCPVILWLEGGPGVPDMNGLFDEDGPLQVDVNRRSSLRNITWIRQSGFAMLYVDNPIGTGFSFTDDELGYSRNPNDISRNFYSVLQQFFRMFPEYHNNSFFISALSYACKYAIVLANLIHELNHEHPATKINLKAITVGGGFCTLPDEDNYADYLIQIGLIDQNTWGNFTAQQNQLNYFINTKQFANAFHVSDSLILGYTVNESVQHNVTDQAAMSTLRDSAVYEGLFYYVPYIERNDTRRAIHAGTSRPFNALPLRVLQPLELDIAQSISPAIETILNLNYPILFYNGNADTLTSPSNVENLLLQLEWKGASKFRQARQHIYRLNNNASTVTSYVRQADNLYYVLVRNAGHMVPFDLPPVGLDLITRFVRAFEADCTNDCENNMLFV